MNSEWLIVRPIRKDKTLYCCSREELNRGSWTLQEDQLLSNYIQAHGHGNWRTLPPRAGLNRSGKSCRLRWLNYLSPDIVRGNISKDEEDLIIRLHSLLGNRWSLIAKRLPGRTDNEIKNHWNTYMAKRLCSTIRKKRPESVEKKRNPRLFHTKAVRCKSLRFPIANPNQGSYGCQMIIGKNASSTSHESTNHDDDLNVASMHLGDPKAVHGELECVVAHCHGNKQCCNNNVSTTWTMGNVSNTIDQDHQELGRVMVYDHGYGQGSNSMNMTTTTSTFEQGGDWNPHCSLTDIDVLNEDPYYVQNPVADDLFPWAEDYQAFTVNDANCHPYEYELLTPFMGGDGIERLWTTR